MTDKLAGRFKAEEEMFRVIKNNMNNLQVMKTDPVRTGGKTYYSVFAFSSNGTNYSLTHAPGTAEDTAQFGIILNKA